MRRLLLFIQIFLFWAKKKKHLYRTTRVKGFLLAYYIVVHYAYFTVLSFSLSSIIHHSREERSPKLVLLIYTPLDAALVTNQIMHIAKSNSLKGQEGKPYIE